MHSIDSQEYWEKRHSFARTKWKVGIALIPICALIIFLLKGEPMGIVLTIGIWSLFYLWHSNYERREFIQPRIRSAREASQASGEFIDNYTFPQGIMQNIKTKYGHLSDTEIDEVLELLKEYFHMCSIATIGAAGSASIKKEKEILCVGMPSKIVDEAWHEFILFTKDYAEFCKKALGKFLHHTPSSAMSDGTSLETAIQNAWRIACHRSELNPVDTSDLPAIFGIDKKLGVKDGFSYEPSVLVQKQKNNNARGSCGGGGYYGASSSFGCSATGTDPSNCGLGGCGGNDGAHGCSGGCGGD